MDMTFWLPETEAALAQVKEGCSEGSVTRFTARHYAQHRRISHVARASPPALQSTFSPSSMPTVSLDVISLVASSCGYYRGHIEQRAAHEFAVHVAIQRGRAKRPQHRHPPRAQPVAPLRERHCRRPRLPPRRCTAQAPSRDQGQPGGAHGRSNDPIASPFHVMRCPPVSPLFASWQWLLHTGCSLEALDMTVH